MDGALLFLFSASGAAALVFENLWFHGARLAFGDSVWAGALVLASFMAGQGLGNLWIARRGDRVPRPLRLYAQLEGVVALSGLALAYGLPRSAPLMAAALAPLSHSFWLLQPARLALGFALLLLPATAMGATLPLLARVLVQRDPRFGNALGRLYAWNTAGAVAGTLGAQTLLLERFGVTGTGAVAALTDLAVAAIAARLAGSARRAGGDMPREPGATPPATRAGARALLASTFLAGALLLALEVVWFRFAALTVVGRASAFAVMLAVVLAGIAGGAALAARWLRSGSDAARHAPALALLAGALCAAGYGYFALVLTPWRGGQLGALADVCLVSAALMLPVSLVSGLLFPFTGALYGERVPAAARASGSLLLANTAGSALGPLLAAFVLLPGLGIEDCFFAACLGYAAVAVLLALALGRAAIATPGRRRLLGAGTLAWIGAVLWFPHGSLLPRYLAPANARYDPEHRGVVVAVREGRNATNVLLRFDLAGQAVDYQLLTDGYSMSGTRFDSRRYMKLFVYWPVAMSPGIESALLISYGVGSSAQALVATPGLGHIQVVDTSREILALSPLIHPGPGEDPLADPRVRVSIDDGRWFLERTRERYDLITGEPPPPKLAGVTDLYTREYFEVMRSRLREGGIATYWLPLHVLTPDDARSIAGAFCGAFPGCSLWSGSDLDLMLVGVRGELPAPDPEAFAAQWRLAAVHQELLELGLDSPAQLGALFVADEDQLRAWIGARPPLSDEFPKRLSEGGLSPRSEMRLRHGIWLDSAAAEARFRSSAWIARHWPERWREASLAAFEFQEITNRALQGDAGYAADPLRRFRDLFRVLTGSQLQATALWLLGTHQAELRALSAGGSLPRRQAAAQALAERDYARAEALLEAEARAHPGDAALLYHRVVVACAAGDGARAARLAGEAARGFPGTGEDRGFWLWAGEACGVPDPHAARNG